MSRKYNAHPLQTLLLSIIIFAGVLFAGDKNKECRVYQYVIMQAEVDFDSITQSIEAAALSYGWQFLAAIDAGSPEDCQYRGRVLAIYDSAYAEKVMQANASTGPFVLVDRVNIFEDEKGTHVSIVNPHSVNRTVLMDDKKFVEMSEEHLIALRGLIQSAVKGNASDKQYGQKRAKGYIDKTMGVMAGGAFEDKLSDEIAVTGSNLQNVAAKVRAGLGQKGQEWGMHLVYEVPLPAYNTVVFGTTGTPMDSKSFTIVKAGSDKSRKKYECPGLAHGGAYPISVVLVEQDGQVKVRMVDTMYRMKMYFEDAGRWAFMMNMGMPGSIADEVRAQINNALGTDVQ